MMSSENRRDFQESERDDGSIRLERAWKKQNVQLARDRELSHRLNGVVTSIIGFLPDYFAPYLTMARPYSTGLVRWILGNKEDVTESMSREAESTGVMKRFTDSLRNPVETLFIQSGMKRVSDRFWSSESFGEFVLSGLEGTLPNNDPVGRATEMRETEIEVLRNRCENLREIITTKEKTVQAIHGRVTNNFREILSLLRVKKKKSDNSPEEVLDQALLVLSNVLSIYETSQSVNDLERSRFNLKSYLRDLTYSIVRTLTPKGVESRVNFRVVDASVPTDIVFPLTLVTNELITEAIRQGLKRGETDKAGTIIISVVFERSNGSGHLEISDNNSHSSPGAEFREVESPELEFVSNLVDNQLKGSIKHSGNKLSNSWNITFPLSETSRNGRDSLEDRRPQSTETTPSRH